MPGPIGTATGAAVAHLASFNQLVSYILSRANEDPDGTSDWQSTAESAVVEAFYDWIQRRPWLGLRKYPPGALALLAPITNLTVTATAGGTSGTLSATYASSLTDYVLIPSGADYIIRITAHTAASAALTLDAVPVALSASACTIVKIEYDLATDCGVLADSGFWTNAGDFIPIIKEEQFRIEHPEVPQSTWPARAACRVARGKVRFSSYPTAAKRLEYPYNYEPADPSGDGDLVIDEMHRPYVAERALSILLEAKEAMERVKLAEARYHEGIQVAAAYEERLLVGLGQHANKVRAGRGYGN